MKPVLTIRGATRRYGRRLAVDGADLTLAPGRITCLLGPSGCGKSTLLRLIAGLEPLDAGEIRAGERRLSGPGTHVPPERRDVGLVFQDYALFPHLRVAENVAFGLEDGPRRERRARALALLERVRLAARADAWPGELSGGEQQRVALARALAREPGAVLLDEPFSGLDGALRAEVREAALAALRAAGAAVLIVTHDAEEAMLMADDLALMSQGRILQCGPPEQGYLAPVSMAAARLLGEANLLPGRVVGGVAETPFGDLPAPGRPEGPVEVMARPEAFRLGQGVEAEVAAARFLGPAVTLTLAAGGCLAEVRTAGPAPAPGQRVRVSLDPARCRLFP